LSSNRFLQEGCLFFIITTLLTAMSGRYTWLFLFLLLVSCNPSDPVKNEINNNPDSSAGKHKEDSKRVFGIPSDSFVVLKGRIRQNSILTQILSEYGITPQQVDAVLRNSPDVLDIRRIRTGSNFTVLAEKGNPGKAKYFVYEQDPSISYIFSFTDSLKITPYREKIRTEIKFVSGTIISSMWDAIMLEKLNPELAVYLSDIYAWTIDFFGLQKGDRFRIIYAENYVLDKSIGIERVFGAEFEHAGAKIYAIPLSQGDKESFYDTEGKSLRKEFLKAPLKFSRVTSGYSSGRMHPILRIVRPHYGVDYGASVGTPVYSIGDGKVISTGIEEESGRIVRIRHNSVYSTAYLHLSDFAPGIKAGASVSQGEVIGYVGLSGLSTGPHLDFRFYKNGYPVDPQKVEAPAVEPVLPENMERFEKIRQVMESLLSTIN
jgi:murein DD-endopeptidase MepM/ murein hydrolase activator NlpD